MEMLQKFFFLILMPRNVKENDIFQILMLQNIEENKKQFLYVR